MEAPPPKSFKELLSRYADGERNFVGADLDEDSDNDLSGACLDGIDLSRSFVVASFRRARLRGAVFREANVKTCDFSGADLTGADFRGAALCSTKFAGSIGDGVRLAGAFYHSHEFKDGDPLDW
ncbi:MAG: pentapeptide repeat-containing protein [Opitutaceae bacterium]|nr:pentapeptide repeat-containing protein [Opitutaceae bacterium]